MKPIHNYLLSGVLPILFAVIVSGCQKQYYPPPATSYSISCEEVGSSSTIFVSDRDAIRLLDQEGRPAGPQSSCWHQVMDLAFSEHIKLPPRILKQALKAYNYQKSNEQFSQAAESYFLSISQGEKTYTKQDRTFLAAYAGHTISKAATANDDHLTKIRLLCKNIDPSLYNKLFR